jgi:uncharacterized membrane protein (Fun14 family)
MMLSSVTTLGALAIVVAAVLGVAVLSVPFVIAHRAVITRRQLKVMARALKEAEGQFAGRSFVEQPWAAQEHDAYAFLVAFRSKARFLRWLYWLSILTIPFSGWGLAMLALWALQHSSFATVVRAGTGMKPKMFANEFCAAGSDSRTKKGEVQKG